jgi:hypothetical protein
LDAHLTVLGVDFWTEDGTAAGDAAAGMSCTVNLMFPAGRIERAGIEVPIFSGRPSTASPSRASPSSPSAVAATSWATPP